MKPPAAVGAMCLLAVFAPMPRAAFAQSESRTHVHIVPAEEQALHDLLVKARDESDKNDYAAAQADYERYLEQRPNDAAAHFDLGYVYTAQQQKDKAIAEYRKAVELDPKMIQAQLNLGISLLSGEPKAAIEPLQKVVALNYAFERGHYMLGFAEERSGDAVTAGKEFTVAVKLDPNDADAHGALGRVDLASGKAADAETEFRELLRLKPGDSEAELDLAESLLQQKKTSDGVDALAAYLKANPNDGKARFMQASALTEMGKNDEALTALDLAAKDGPETAEAFKLRSVIYYRKGDFAKEAMALQKAIALAPEDASAHAQLGHALLETKDYAGAVRELNTALRLDPSLTDTMRDLVSAEYLQKDFAGTVLTLEALGRRVPLNAGAWFVRGSCYDHMNQPEEALDAYQKFLAMNTDKGSNQYFEATERVRFLQKVIKQKGH